MKLQNKLAVFAALVLLTAALCGCQVNQIVKASLTYAVRDRIAPYLKAYVAADAALTNAQKSDFNAQIDACVASIVVPKVGGFCIDRKYALKVESYWCTLSELFLQYVANDTNIREDTKRIRITLANHVTQLLVDMLK